MLPTSCVHLSAGSRPHTEPWLGDGRGCAPWTQRSTSQQLWPQGPGLQAHLCQREQRCVSGDRSLTTKQMTCGPEQSHGRASRVPGHHRAPAGCVTGRANPRLQVERQYFRFLG